MTELIQVSNKIWCLRNRSYFVCSYLVKSCGGLVLIDAGMDSTGNAMLNAVRSLGLLPNDIKGILFTHWHNDHAAGAHAISQVSGAPVFYHEADVSNFNGNATRPSSISKFGNLIPELGVLVLFKGLIRNSLPRPVNANQFVHDGEIILDEFQVIETPRHTPGHVSYYFQPQKALFAGDALAVVNEQLRFMAKAVTPNLIDARASMKHCLNKDIKMICPGHREPLIKNIEKEMLLFSEKLNSDHWPLLG